MYRVKVDNLPTNVNSNELRAYFNNVAPIQSFNLQRDKQEGVNTYALISFSTEQDAKAVLQNCNNRSWGKHTLNVTPWYKLSTKKKPMNTDFPDYRQPQIGVLNTNENIALLQLASTLENWQGNQSFTPNRKRSYNNRNMYGGNNTILNNLEEERKNINQRISFLQNSMRLTANNIQNLSGPSPKMARPYYDNYSNKFKGFRRQGGPYSVKERALSQETKEGKAEDASVDVRYSFDTNLVRKMIFCYVRLYGVKSNIAIKRLGECKVLTPAMVRYASGGKVTISAKSALLEKKSDDRFSGPLFSCPRLSKSQRNGLGKSLNLLNKKMRKIFIRHCHDHRFIDVLKKEGPKKVQDELLKDLKVDVDESEMYENLPKCPDPPKNYFKIRQYYEEMQEFRKHFSPSDLMSYNIFKSAMTSLPLMSSKYRKSIIYCVQVLGVYDIKDKKFVLKILARHAPMVVLTSEPILTLGFYSEEAQKAVLDRNGERLYHMKLYLRPFEPLWFKALPEMKKNYAIRDLRDCERKYEILKSLFFNILDSYAPHVPASELPDCDAIYQESDESLDDAEEVSIAFDEEVGEFDDLNLDSDLDDQDDAMTAEEMKIIDEIEKSETEAANGDVGKNSNEDASKVPEDDVDAAPTAAVKNGTSGDVADLINPTSENIPDTSNAAQSTENGNI